MSAPEGLTHARGATSDVALQDRSTAVHDVRRISRRFAMNTLRHVLAVGAALFVAGFAADAQIPRTTSTV